MVIREWQAAGRGKSAVYLAWGTRFDLVDAGSLMWWKKSKV
jgi:hypothetical protein